MRYEDLSAYQKSRVRDDICTICQGKFNKFDDVQEVKIKYGRAMLYFHFHTSCLINQRYSSQLGREVKNEEEFERV